MHLLCLDVGSGTQDILLLDTTERTENAVQMVLPSPTRLAAGKIVAATSRGIPVALTGETMGGGAITWALRAHLEAGLGAFATPEAARTFDDDLDEVASWGVKLVAEEEARLLDGVAFVQTGDVSLDVLGEALAIMDVRLSPDVVAVAVLDHGAAPPGESDRIFRFQNLERQLRLDRSLEGFIYTPDELPAYLTRMQAVAHSLAGLPLVLMDTGAAAVMGATLDAAVATRARRLCINAGNSHTIGFHLDGDRVLGMFEHHTSLLTAEKLDALVGRLLSCELTAAEVQEDGGHGAVVFEPGEIVPFASATGPRRHLLGESRLQPHFAAPFGSMMLTGCYGLARAVALKLPEWREELEPALEIT